MTWRKWLLGGLLVWIAIVAWWAVTPLSDTVPTGLVTIKKVANTPTSQTVQCASPLSGNTKPTEPLPVLKPDTRSYQRDPCKLPHQNDRLILIVDVVLVIGVLIILLKTWKPAEHLTVDVTSTA
jgi:hypothetical protein